MGEDVQEHLALIRRRSIQAIGAGISTRNWHTVETAYNEARDMVDALLTKIRRAQIAPTPNLDSYINGYEDAQEVVCLPLVNALREIADLEKGHYEYPADWSGQIAACAECKSYEHHPIQRGICDTHRRPIWAREAWEKSEDVRLGSRAKEIARKALAALCASTPTQNHKGTKDA